MAVVGVLFSAMTVLAQNPAAADHAVDNTAGLKAIAAGIGFAIAVVGVCDWPITNRCGGL